MQERPWLTSYRSFGIPAEIAPPTHESVTELMQEAMRRYADKPAFRSFGQTLTYADVDRQSRDFAAYLQAQGVKRGDRIGVMVPNILAFPVAMLGIIRAGAAQVNINPLYTPRELKHQLQDAGCEILVIYNGSTPTLAEITEHTPLRSIVSAGLALDSGSALPSPPVDARLSNVLPLSSTPAEPPACRRAPHSHMAICWPTWRSSEPSCPPRCVRARRSWSPPSRCITSSR